MECGFFFFRRWPFLGIQCPQRLDGGEVPLKLLFRPAFTDVVGSTPYFARFGDASRAYRARTWF